MTPEPAEMYRQTPAGPSDRVHHLPRLEITQRLMPMVSRYEIREAPHDDRSSRFLAIAQQKRVTMKEQVVFFADEARRTPLFSLTARRALELAPVYDVVDAIGAPIGSFQKDFTASMTRSSFHLEGAGVEAYGQERSRALAFLRRFSNSKIAFIVDFTDEQTGQRVMSAERKSKLRDSYTIDVPDVRIDFRLAVAMTVGLDLDMQP